MSNHYVGRVFKFYMCNVPSAVNMMAGIVKGWLTDRQKQKLFILEDVRQLRSEFALHQLEEDLGGSRPRITEFFPFPLQAGPFEAGFSEGPDKASPPGVHEVLCEDAAIGCLWERGESAALNAKLELRHDARKVFTRRGYPVPPEL